MRVLVILQEIFLSVSALFLMQLGYSDLEAWYSILLRILPFLLDRPAS